MFCSRPPPSRANGDLNCFRINTECFRKTLLRLGNRDRALRAVNATATPISNFRKKA
jgi:hypothetical protein